MTVASTHDCDPFDGGPLAPEVVRNEDEAGLVLPGPVVSPGWLAAHLDDPRVMVVDASVGEARGEVRTIAGGRRFDIDGDLSDLDSDVVHTMPPAAQLQRAVRALGICDDSLVVAYDAQGIFSSARAWWMLRAMGHDAVAILDGGLPGWIAAGLPTTERDLAGATSGDFTARPREGFFVDAAEVINRLSASDAVVLDARSAARFAGTEPEPRPGLRSGHMPGAVSLPFTDLESDGFLLSTAEITKRVAAAVGGADRITASCGSGVTACVLALGAYLSGYHDITVYDGSWSEWGRPGELPVVRDE